MLDTLFEDFECVQKGEVKMKYEQISISLLVNLIGNKYEGDGSLTMQSQWLDSFSVQLTSDFIDPRI